MAVPKRVMSPEDCSCLPTAFPRWRRKWKAHEKKEVTSMPQEIPPRLEFPVDVTEKETIEASHRSARRDRIPAADAGDYRAAVPWGCWPSPGLPRRCC